MTKRLLPCRSCRRHIFAQESACPFCGARARGEEPRPPRRVLREAGRAALFAATTSLAASGCYLSHDTDGPSAPRDGGDEPDALVSMDSGRPDSGRSRDAAPLLPDAAPTDAGPDSPLVSVPLYGGAPPTPGD